MGSTHSSHRPGPNDRADGARRSGGQDFRSAGRWWTSDRAGRLAVCGLLLLAVGLVFGQAAGFDFVNYDDPEGVTENRLVTGQLTPRRLAAVFTERHLESWAPLTCVSHVLVWHLLGHGAAVHHLTNVALHAASAVLLLIVLWRMTGRLWPSALAAAIFALHPLRGESVAWVTERKDVLSGLFFMLTLAAYLGYARRPFSLVRYLAVLACFIASLAAKPMAVTLPFLLLLLDYWPLGRFAGGHRRGSKEGERGREGEGEIPLQIVVRVSPPLPLSPSPSLDRRVIWEKLPLLAIAGLFCLVAVRGQDTSAMEVNRAYSFAWRTGNGLISYMVYLGQFFCPLNLVPFYPRRPVPLPTWQAAAAALILAGVTLAAFGQRRRRPYLLVGWLWYLGMLVPVIGVVQFGAQAEADRFTYLPQIGLAVALAWTAGEAFRRWPAGRRAYGLGAAFVLTAMIVCAWRQTGYWCDSFTLWTHTLACNPRNVTAHVDLGTALKKLGRNDEAMAQYRTALAIGRDDPAARRDAGVALAFARGNLGVALMKRGRTDEAIEQYRQALKYKPDFATAHYNLGIALAKGGRTDEAIGHYRRAVELKPDFVEAHRNLAAALAGRGQIGEAIDHYRQALELRPDFVEAHCDLAAVLASRGRADEAIAHYQQALELQPDQVEIHCRLAAALAGRGRTSEAIAHYQRALELNPDFVAALNNLAWLRATRAEASLGNPAAAIELAQRASRLSGGNAPDILDTLAAAYAAAGMFSQAQETVRAALTLARQQKLDALAETLQARLRLYEAKTPYREPPAPYQSTGGRRPAIVF